MLQNMRKEESVRLKLNIHYASFYIGEHTVLKTSESTLELIYMQACSSDYQS